MSPLKQSKNIAARMGRWSASHWKTATFGWLAFVDRLVRDRHRRAGDDDRAEGRRRRRGRQGQQDHRRGLRSRRERARRARDRPVGDEDRRRSRVPCHDRRGDHGPERLRAGEQAPLAARCRQRGSDLARPPRGVDHVQPEGQLRRGHALHRLDRRRHRAASRRPIRTSTWRRPASRPRRRSRR